MPRAKLSNISLPQLIAELNRRKAKLTDLIAQRDDLDQQIAALEALTGATAEPAKKTKRRGRKPGPKPGKKAKPGLKATRGRRGKPLAAFVQEALAAAPKGLDVRSIEKAVLAAGYVTKGKDLYNPVAAALGKIKAKKVSRGVYALKPAGKKPGRKPGKKKAAAPAAVEKK